jgi:subtilisin-like proprotein convertase family protein
LQVILIAPTGKRVIVHNRTGGTRNDLKQSYEGLALRELDGLEGLGIWSLQVIDGQGRQVGKLHFWKIELELRREASEPLSHFVDVGKHLTPGDAGVSATVKVHATNNRDWRPANLAIHLDIERTYITDLALTLQTPSGKKLMLNECRGWTKRGKRWTIEGENIPGLAGERLEGTFALSISGTGKAAYGRLERWGITCHESSDIGKLTELGPHATEYLSNAGVNTVAALDAAIPLEVSSILALRGHKEAVRLADRLAYATG